jgi:predicted kinase
MSRGGEPAARGNSRELVRKLGTIEIRQQECRQQECRQAAKPGYSTDNWQKAYRALVPRHAVQLVEHGKK